MRTLLLLVSCSTLAVAAACGGDDDVSPDPEPDGAVDADGSSDDDAGDGPSADCDAGPIPSFDDVAIFATCVVCHGTDVTGDARASAPPTVNFDDYDSAVAASERAAFYVFYDIMPPRNTDIRVSDVEKEQFYLWALCGTPE